MTPQEQQMIGDLIQRVQNTPLPEKDPQAEQMLQQGFSRNPDALYILAQTVLVQGYALEQSQKQLADAKAQLEVQQQPSPAKHGSFLSSIFGSGEPDRPSPAPAYAPVPNSNQSAPPYAQSTNYPPPGTPFYPAQPPPGGGGFLRGAMQTAAGVAAGAVAFEGIESLMHGFGGHGGGSAFGSLGGADAPREEVVNNYYGSDSAAEREHSFLGNDVEDRRDDVQDSSSAQDDFASTDNDDASSDDFSSSDDNAGTDDSSFS